MRTSSKGIDLICYFEGFSAKPYLCPANVPTIGYGATYYADGRKVTMQDKPITQAQGKALLAAMLGTYEQGVSKLVKVPLTQNQFDALVSFAYNVGVAAFAKSTLLRKLNNADYKGAADGLLAWNKGGGKVLVGLTRRRQAEKELFLK